MATWALPVALGVVLRLLWIWHVDAAPVSDATAYLAGAHQLASAGEYTAGGQPTAYWPVGYPAALSLAFRAFGTEHSVAQAFNALLSCGLMVGLYWVALRLGLSKATAATALWWAALNPVYIAYCSLTVSDHYFTCLMLWGTVIVLPARVTVPRLLLGGAFFGMAALSRAHGLLLPVLAGAFAVSQASAWRQAVRRVAWLGLGLSLAMSPWWIRNARAFDAFVPVSTNGGVNLLIGNNPRANGTYLFDAATKAALGEHAPYVGAGGAAEVEADRYAGRLAREYMAEHPRQIAALLPVKLLHTYLPDLTGVWWNAKPDSPGRRTLLALLRIVTLAHQAGLLLFAAIGVLALTRRLRSGSTQSAVPREAVPLQAIALPGAFITAFTLVHLLYFGASRFHFPMTPWLELWAAVGTLDVGRRVGQRLGARRLTASA